MAVKDYVGSAVNIKQSLTFDIKELYKTLKIWLSDRGYNVMEPKYSEMPMGESLKKTSFVWNCEKKVDPYTKLAMEISFNAETKDIAVEKDETKHLAQEGEVEIVFVGYIARDLEEDWALREKTGMQRFFRELYDKFSKKGKYEDYEARLKKDIDSVVYDVKTYLKLHRFD